MVWFSILFHLSAVGATIYLFMKRNILSFALAFYLLHLLLVSNLIMNLGATMGERLIYHSSFGFAIIIAIFKYIIHEDWYRKGSSNISKICSYWRLVNIPLAKIP